METFAVYFSEYLSGSNFPFDEAQIARFTHRLINPSTDDLAYHQHWLACTEDFEKKELNASKSEIETAMKIDASSPLLYMTMAGIASSRDECIKWLQKACDLFTSSGVRADDRVYVKARGWLNYVRNTKNPVGPEPIENASH